MICTCEGTPQVGAIFSLGEDDPGALVVARRLQDSRQLHSHHSSAEHNDGRPIQREGDSLDHGTLRPVGCTDRADPHAPADQLRKPHLGLFRQHGFWPVEVTYDEPDRATKSSGTINLSLTLAVCQQ